MSVLKLRILDSKGKDNNNHAQSIYNLKGETLKNKGKHNLNNSIFYLTK